MKGRRAQLQSTFLGILGLAGILVCWVGLSAILPPSRLPSPSTVLAAVRQNWFEMPVLSHFTFAEGGFANALEYTTINVLVAIAVGTVIGVAWGVLIGYLRIPALLSQPLLRIGVTVPLLIALPFITLWFGTARFAQSGLVLFFAILTVTLTEQSAARVVGDEHANFAASLGASSSQILRSVILPATLPELIGAVRIALAAGWGWQCVAELLGARAGVGRIIQVTGKTQALDALLGIMLCVAAVAVVIDLIVAGLGRYMTRWADR